MACLDLSPRVCNLIAVSAENFGRYFYHSIREQNEIFSATGNGRIPWVSVQDLAQLAFEALTAEKCANTDKFVFGPELYTYDEVRLISRYFL